MTEFLAKHEVISRPFYPPDIAPCDLCVVNWINCYRVPIDFKGAYFKSDNKDLH